ncbi:MAG TPA: hypothetical protein V6D05_00830 [Stenomitos sp.]
MKSLRWLALGMTALVAIAGCGASPAGTSLSRPTSQQVDAQSREGLNAALKVYLTNLYRRLDQNGDGKLTQAEASAFFTPEQFANLNLNGNAYLTLSEMLNNRAFLAKAAAKLRDYARDTLALSDADRDGRLSWPEYLASINANATLTTGEKTYAQLAFNLSDRNHDGYLVLDEYEDMVSMAQAQAAATAATLSDAYGQAQAHVVAKYGQGLIPMGVSIRWMNKFGQFTRDDGAYAFTYWTPLEGKGNSFNEVLVKVYQDQDPASARDVKAVHTADAAPVGIDFSKLVTPTQAIDAAVKAGVPTVGDRTSYFIQYVAASGGMPDRIYVDAYQVLSTGDNRLGGITLEAATGKPVSQVTK